MEKARVLFRNAMGWAREAVRLHALLAVSALALVGCLFTKPWVSVVAAFSGWVIGDCLGRVIGRAIKNARGE